MTEDKDERTYHMTQKVLKEEVDTATQAKVGGGVNWLYSSGGIWQKTKGLSL